MIVGLLARHGENPENKTNQFRGRIDMPLDQNGIKQAHELADFIMSRYTIERIVSSPLLRAMQTAEIVGQTFGLPVIQERSLMATDTGFLTGEEQEEFMDIYQFYIDNPDKVIPRGESFDGVNQRIGDYFEEELKSDTFTLYVSHSSCGVVLANLIAGNRDLKPGIDHLTEPGGLAEISWDGQSYEIEPVFLGSKKETPQYE